MRNYFAFYPSRQLAVCIFLGHGVAFGALVLVPIPKVALILLLIVLSLSSIYYVLRDAQLSLPGACIALRLEGEQVVLFNRNGDELTGRLLRSSVITPYMVILNIVLENHRWRQNVILLSDSMDAELFRQLRVTLKWGVELTDTKLKIKKTEVS